MRSLIARFLAAITLKPSTSAAMLLCSAALVGGGLATWAAFTDTQALGNNSFSVDALSKHLGVSTPSDRDRQADGATYIATGGDLGDLALAFGTTDAGKGFGQLFKVTNTTTEPQRAKLVDSGRPQQLSAVTFADGEAETVIPAGGDAWVLATTSTTVDGTGTGAVRLAYSDIDVKGADTTSRWMHADLPVTITNRPAAPANLEASPGTAGAIDLTWSQSTTQGVTQYDVYRKAGSGEYVKLTSSPVAALTYRDTTAAAGTTYTYAVRAVHGSLESAHSTPATASPSVAKPDPPVLTSVTAKHGGTIDLAWSAPTGSVDGYRVYRGTATGTYAPAPIGSPTGTSFTDSTAVNGVTHFYVVRAVRDGVESESSNERSATADGAGPQTAVTTPGGSVRGAVALSASATDPSGVASVTFERSAVGTGSWTPIGSPDTTSPYGVSWDTTGLVDGQHDVRARAVDSLGHTTTSASVRFVVDNAAPRAAAVDRAGAGATHGRTRATAIHWTVAFSEPVTGVDATDFAIVRSNVTGGSISSVAGSGTTYTVTVSGYTLPTDAVGTVRLDLVDNDSIVDAAGNALVGGSGANGSVTGPDWTLDTKKPTATVSFAQPSSGGTAGKLEAGDRITLTFDEAVTGFPTADIAVRLARNGDKGDVSLQIDGLVAQPGSTLGTPSYIGGNGSRTSAFTGGTMAVAGNALTITVGSAFSGEATAVGTSAAYGVVFDGALTDLAGNSVATLSGTGRWF